MKKHMALLALVLAACATATPAADTRPLRAGNVPLVQIQNDTYSEAMIYLDGVRFGSVRGSGTVLLPIPTARIASTGLVHFTVRLISTDETANLPVVEYREGRNIRITLKPLLSASTAY